MVLSRSPNTTWACQGCETCRSRPATTSSWTICLGKRMVYERLRLLDCWIMCRIISKWRWAQIETFRTPHRILDRRIWRWMDRRAQPVANRRWHCASYQTTLQLSKSKTSPPTSVKTNGVKCKDLDSGSTKSKLKIRSFSMRKLRSRCETFLTNKWSWEPSCDRKIKKSAKNLTRKSLSRLVKSLN